MDSQNRQEIVRAAISFLQNPKLMDSSLNDKLQFLKDKGLTQIEIDEALNLALINRQNTQHSRWNFLIILGLCVGGYKLYQTYLESRETYMTQKKEEALRQSEEAKKEVSAQKELDQQAKDAPTLTEILQKMTELKSLIELQRNNINKDIQSLKTLLLGHEKFAAPPLIPAWQLKNLDDHEDTSSETGPSKVLPPEPLTSLDQ